MLAQRAPRHVARMHAAWAATSAAVKRVLGIAAAGYMCYLLRGRARKVSFDTMNAVQTQPEAAMCLLCAQEHQETHRCVAYK